MGGMSVLGNLRVWFGGKEEAGSYEIRDGDNHIGSSASNDIMIRGLDGEHFLLSCSKNDGLMVVKCLSSTSHSSYRLFYNPLTDDVAQRREESGSGSMAHGRSLLPRMMRLVHHNSEIHTRSVTLRIVLREPDYFKLMVHYDEVILNRAPTKKQADELMAIIGGTGKAGRDAILTSFYNECYEKMVSVFAAKEGGRHTHTIMYDDDDETQDFSKYTQVATQSFVREGLEAHVLSTPLVALDEKNGREVAVGDREIHYGENNQTQAYYGGASTTVHDHDIDAAHKVDTATAAPPASTLLSWDHGDGYRSEEIDLPAPADMALYTAATQPDVGHDNDAIEEECVVDDTEVDDDADTVDGENLEGEVDNDMTQAFGDSPDPSSEEKEATMLDINVTTKSLDAHKTVEDVFALSTIKSPARGISRTASPASSPVRILPSLSQEAHSTKKVVSNSKSEDAPSTKVASIPKSASQSPVKPSTATNVAATVSVVEAAPVPVAVVAPIVADVGDSKVVPESLAPDAVEALSYMECKAACKARNLPSNGAMADLKKRLNQYYVVEVTAVLKSTDDTETEGEGEEEPIKVAAPSRQSRRNATNIVVGASTKESHAADEEKEKGNGARKRPRSKSDPIFVSESDEAPSAPVAVTEVTEDVIDRKGAPKGKKRQKADDAPPAEVVEEAPVTVGRSTRRGAPAAAAVATAKDEEKAKPRELSDSSVAKLKGKEGKGDAKCEGGGGAGKEKDKGSKEEKEAVSRKPLKARGLESEASTTSSTGKRKKVDDDDKSISSSVKDDVSLSATKKRKTSPAAISPIDKPRVLFTNVSEKYSAEFLEIITALGGVTDEDVTKATHLVADDIVRTVKMLCCVSTCRHIVTSSWLRESKKVGYFLLETPYLLRDPEKEKHFNCNLVDAMKRRDALRENKAKSLLSGVTVFVTPDVRPPPTEMAKIITCAGGKALSSLPKGPLTNGQRLYIISTEEEVAKKKDLQAKLRSIGAPIYTSDIFMNGVMNQHIDWGNGTSLNHLL